MNTLLNHDVLNENQHLSTAKMPFLRQSIGLTLVGFIVSGVLYSAASVAVAQWIFPEQANGSVIELNGKVVGSSLVGQNFSSEQYFQSRPSAVNYNADSMSGSNMAVSNPALQKQIHERTVQFAQQNAVAAHLVPDEMVTASGSGIDPDISPQSALLQVKRIAEKRHLSESAVQSLVEQHIQPKQFNLFGQARVNVLQLNLALDQLSQHPK